MSEHSNPTRQVMEATGITARALARKLGGVNAQEVEGWARGEGEPPATHQAAILALLERTQVREPTRVPRVSAPGLESSVVCQDSLTAIRALPEQSVHLILSDIPYGIGLDDWDVLHDNTNSAYLGASEAQLKAGRVFQKRRKPINGWSAADRQIPALYQAWCTRWASEWLRVLKPGGSACVFAGRRLAHRCVVALEEAGFLLRDQIAWHRPGAAYRAQRLSVVYQKRGDLADAQRWAGWRVGNLRPTFEPILWLFKPYATTVADNVLDHGVGAMQAERWATLTGAADNVIQMGFEPGEGGLHEAQKPVALMQALIELCTEPDQLVLDPFAGSGSTAVAAARAGRRFYVIEQDERLCQVIRERLGPS